MGIGTWVVSMITWDLYKDYRTENRLSQSEIHKEQMGNLSHKLYKIQKDAPQKYLMVDLENHYEYLKNVSDYTFNQYEVKSELFENYTFNDEIEEQISYYQLDHDSEYFFDILKRELSYGWEPPINFWTILSNVFSFENYQRSPISEDYSLRSFKADFFKTDGISAVEYVNEETTERYLANYFSQNIRSKEFIINFWEAHKDNIKAFMPSIRMKYGETLNQRIKDLLLIYDECVMKSPYKDLFKEYNYDDEALVSELDFFLEDITLSAIDTVKYGYVNDQERKLELFGFWDRRYTEENMKTIVEILKEIQKTSK